VPSVGHVAVGLAAARAGRTPEGLGRGAWALLLATLSLLPDVDVVAFRLGIPYGAPLGHRGALHSLAFALVAGSLVGAGASTLGLPGIRVGLMSVMVLVSHGLLDTLTDGGKGVALLWPLSTARYFAPWRPIPVAPIGARLLSHTGVALMAHETLLFLPLFALAAWPRRRGGAVGDVGRSPEER
jgi:inner membrane protein